MHQVEIATTQQTLLDSPEMTLNMGPQHPSTHGVLRVVLKLDGETVIDLDCDIGYLHRGMEKISENRTYAMIAPYWDRLDYIAAVSNGLVWVETVEQMMGLDVPRRAHYIRTILTELNRIASHLLWLGTHALDIGAVTILLWAFREREEILKIFERQFGARLTCHAWRIGGMPNDAYDDFEQDVRRFINNLPERLDEYETVLSENRIWLSRTVGIGVVSPERALALGFTGPMLRGSGVEWDLRKKQPYAAYDKVQFDVPFRVSVGGREQLVADRGLDGELFAQLAHETRRERFSGIAFAAGKLPVAFEVDTSLPPRDQEAAIALDDRRRHDDRCHLSGVNGYARQLLAIGHTRHFGSRATHTIAPKSISA